MASSTTNHLGQYSDSPTFDITVLISGSGSNLQALIDASTSGRLSTAARVTHVISNRRDAYGLVRAQTAGIATTYHNLVAYKKRYLPSSSTSAEAKEAALQQAREQYDRDLAQKILTHIPSPDLVVCAGWMHILSADFVAALAAAGVPIINLHPALPGQFAGAGAIQRAWEAFQHQQITETGVMVHHVISEVDAGQPIVVKRVPLRAGESLADLESRVHQVEWEAIVEATDLVLATIRDTRKSSK